jgi:DNA-binding IclR family transcriptional regulator
VVEAGDGGTESAARVADILLAFTNGPTNLGVTAVSHELDLSKAVVHRTLQSLVSRQLLVVDPVSRKYRLGPAAAVLGARALRDSQLRMAAMPILVGLARASGETATLSQLVGHSRVYLDQIESSQEIKMTVEIGRQFPLHAGSSGRVILAFLSEFDRELVLTGELSAPTPLTTVDPGEIRATLEQAREEGVAVSHGERQPGAGSVAAPVFGVDGNVVGSLSICGPLYRFNDEAVDRCKTLVRKAGRELSIALGWHGAAN